MISPNVCHLYFFAMARIVVLSSLETEAMVLLEEGKEKEWWAEKKNKGGGEAWWRDEREEKETVWWAANPYYLSSNGHIINLVSFFCHVWRKSVFFKEIPPTICFREWRMSLLMKLIMLVRTSYSSSWYVLNWPTSWPLNQSADIFRGKSCNGCGLAMASAAGCLALIFNKSKSSLLWNCLLIIPLVGSAAARIRHCIRQAIRDEPRRRMDHGHKRVWGLVWW